MQPSLLKSPVATPMPYPRERIPLASVTSVNRSVRVPSAPIVRSLRNSRPPAARRR